MALLVLFGPGGACWGGDGAGGSFSAACCGIDGACDIIACAAGSLLGRSGPFFGVSVFRQLPLRGEQLTERRCLAGQAVVLAADQEPILHHGAYVSGGTGADPDAAAVDVE